jgi:hypothetical protein
VAAPIAAHILEQIVAMEQGTFNVELTKLAPARNPNPFATLAALTDYKNAGTYNITPDDEGTEHHGPSEAKVQMGGSSAHPDIRAEADARGRVQKGGGAPPPKPADNRTFFQKFFGIKPSAPNPPPRPSGPSGRSGH